MSKRIKSKLYMRTKISLKAYMQDDNTQGFLYSAGKYRTKILSEDLPEWYIHGYLYKRYGFISAKGVKHLLYDPNYTFENHLHKYDTLFISYDTDIEPYQTEGGLSWYKGYDHAIDGSLIVRFVEAVEKFSDYDVSKIKQELARKQKWYDERNSKDGDNHVLEESEFIQG